MTKVLIIDADSEARLSVVQALIKKRDTGGQTGSAEAVLAQIQSANPDILVIDSRPPEVPHSDLMEALKPKFQHTEHIAAHAPQSLQSSIEARSTQMAGSAFPFVLPVAGISMDTVEKNFILQALEMSGNNKTRAAKLLGISRRAMYSKMKTHGMATPSDTSPVSPSSRQIIK